jgi:hypothetical protein
MKALSSLAAILTFAGGLASPVVAKVFPVPFAVPVPEPASWATMIIGFAIVGVAMRRRAAVQADI